MGGVWAKKEVLGTGCVHDARELIAILADQPHFGVITQPNVQLLPKTLAEFVHHFGKDPIFLCWIPFERALASGQVQDATPYFANELSYAPAFLDILAAARGIVNRKHMVQGR